MSVKLVNDATAILSMRDSDFDAYSAYGEVVDNSIQAEAKRIYIDFSTELHKQGRKSYEIINEITFIDDGVGMDTDILQRCLQLGYSSRFNDRNGIGRFGVGMTLGAIHECQRVEVTSKINGGAWHTTSIDLSKIDISKPEASVEIKSPEQVSDPNELKANGLSLSSGTIVKWKKYDRQADSAGEIIKETRIWLGRTFRYFIWSGVEIFLNGEKIRAIDPLYSENKETKFPEDPTSQIFDKIEIDWPVPFDVNGADGDISTVEIKLSLLPEELRPNRGAGNSTATTDRYIDRNQGVSILRNNREVFYGPIPYWPGKSDWFKEIDRWWGCEIHFSPVLDRAFTVKNIKRGAVPNKELKRAIYDRISPTVRSCLEEIRRVWDKAKAENNNSDNQTDTGHDKAEKIVKKVKTDKTSKPVENPEKAEEELLDRLKKEKSEEERKAWAAKWRDQPYSIEEDSWRGKEFMEVEPLGGNDLMIYNLNHPFMQKLYSIIEVLEEKDDSVEKDLAIQLKCLMDLLLISYNKAEAKFDPNSEIVVSDYAEQILINWGQYLQSYLKGWERIDD